MKSKAETQSGIQIIKNPSTNRGTAFTNDERREKGLEGLLPTGVEDLDTQVARVEDQLNLKTSDLERYMYLQSLAEINQTLFFTTLQSNPSYYIPIVYNPTIADACLNYGHLYRRPQGMYLSKTMKGRFEEVLKNWPESDVRFICITSGGRILGLGDIGVNGAPITVGKLQLYTTCAAIPPQKLLPMHIDIGTSNKKYLSDPLYPGLREYPMESSEIDELMDEFMEAANKVFPNVCVHFEDWKGSDAIRLLGRYKNDYLVYNDDIQGTASVTIAGLITALKIKEEKLSDQKILFAGAGSAATGIANMLVEALKNEGISEKDAESKIGMVDTTGLLVNSREDLNKIQKRYAKEMESIKDLEKIVQSFEATIIIGVSTAGGLFTKSVVQAMSNNTERPIIFPLSNPTDKAECTAEQAYEWSDGKALFAAGVQFPDVTYKGKTFIPGQANNFYIFPALALAVYVTKPKRIDDAMWLAAAKGCADQVKKSQREKGMLFPRQDHILDIEMNTATRIVMDIFERDLATVDEPADIFDWIKGQTYRPSYD